ncbi:MAG TPA: GFA family protein [Ramlibacter sp.]|jgi:hypothetical protein|nr:GFA family protein [Ramlibacter sp.]
MANEEIHQGGCLCGGVRYTVQGRPLRTMVCHCTFCQRFTGSSFYAESIFAREQVEITGLPMRTYDHRSDGSGKLVHLHSCPTCATTVSLTFERSPQIRAISRGTFDDPNWVAIEAHIFTRSAQQGVVLPAGVPCHEEHRITLEGAPREGQCFHQPVAVQRRPE